MEVLSWSEAYAVTEGGTVTDPNTTTKTYHWMEPVLNVAQPLNRQMKASVAHLVARVNTARNIPGMRLNGKAAREVADSQQRAAEAKQARLTAAQAAHATKRARE